jgi:ABC-type Fe3+-hydroxamate transport system substrate-binding protein
LTLGRGDPTSFAEDVIDQKGSSGMKMVLVAAAVLSLAWVPAWAQPAPSVKITGVITGFFKDTELEVRRPNGDVVTVMVPVTTRIGAVANRTLADIKPGDFVGSAAAAGADGKLHALEVHIFPEQMRGTGEGHRPWDEPSQTMTNGAVDGIAAAASGTELKVKYAGGEQTIDVGPTARIVALVPGDRSLLVVGAAVTIRAAHGLDDIYTATNIQAEKDGVKPLS